MRKVFYKPDLTIIGMTDGDEPFDFPFVTTKKNYHSTIGMSIVKKGKKYALKVDAGTLKLDNN